MRLAMDIAVSHGRRKYDNEEASGAYSYANSFSIGYNGYVFIFEFGMTDSQGKSYLRSRLVINPAHAEQFSKMLADTVEQHVSRYGPIKVAPNAGSSYSAEGCDALLQPAASSQESSVRDGRALR